jgi:CRP-like cAMP-binding protein
MSSSPRSTRNLLLKSLSDASFERLEPLLQRVTLPLKHSVQPPGEPIETVYFCETCIACRIATAGAERIAVDITGREGVTGLPVLHHARTSSLESFIQVPGEAFGIAVDDLTACMEEHLDLRQVLLRSALMNASQVAYTALANGRFTVLERTARWILMCHDRMPDDQINLTHEFLALMMGVRRAGVTTDMHVLEGERALSNKRGRIIIRDRAKLEEIAGSCYGAPEAEYEALIGQQLRRQ